MRFRNNIADCFFIIIVVVIAEYKIGNVNKSSETFQFLRLETKVVLSKELVYLNSTAFSISYGIYLIMYK